MSLRGPRPQRSPLATSSHSITPLAPRVMVTRPSDPCAADGMKIPSVRLRADCTSGRRTIWGKWGDPISSSPSATSTKLSGGLRPAPRMACSAARNVASGPFWFTAPRPTSTLRSEEHTSELQSLRHLVCRLLLEKKKQIEVIIANASVFMNAKTAHPPDERIDSVSHEHRATARHTRLDRYPSVARI